MTRSLAALALVGLAAAAPADDKKPAFPADQLAFYEKDVLPVLKTHCYKCHGNGKHQGKLSLESREGILKGGDLGPAVVLDKPADSRLLKAIRYQAGLEMPPDGKIADDAVAVLDRWVKAGLPMPAGKVVEPKHADAGGKVTPESKNYWAYQAGQAARRAGRQDDGWVRNPIDAFVLAKLEAEGLDARRPRRHARPRSAGSTYDLTGLPPTPERGRRFRHRPAGRTPTRS